MHRRDFFKSGLKCTAAYALLATTLLGGHKAAAASSDSDLSGVEEEDLYSAQNCYPEIWHHR